LEVVLLVFTYCAEQAMTKDKKIKTEHAFFIRESFVWGVKIFY
jgi:hypothetical protein